MLSTFSFKWFFCYKSQTNIVVSKIKIENLKKVKEDLFYFIWLATCKNYLIFSLSWCTELMMLMNDNKLIELYVFGDKQLKFKCDRIVWFINNVINSKKIKYN